MKQKKIALFAFALLSCAVSVAQVSQPVIWLRADNTGTDTPVWRDISGNGYDAVFTTDSVKAADTLLNFNPAFRFDGTVLSVPPIEVTEEANSVIIVYQADTAAREELPLWSFQADSTHTLALTTRQIVNSNSTILYGDENSRCAIVNSLTQLWRKRRMADTLYCSGQVGVTDSSAFIGMMAEFVVLPCSENFSDIALYQWCSYLAVKYGITLQETSYLSSDGTVTWPLDSLGQFSGSVIGIGRDDRFGLHQRQSRTADGLLTVALDSVAANNILHGSSFADKEFLMVGSAEAAFNTVSELYMEDDQTQNRYGDGIAKVTGTSILQKPFTMRVDASQWADSLHRYALLVDRSGTGEYRYSDLEIFSPSEIDTSNKTLTFSDIYWDTDGSGCDRFCFAALNLLDLMSEIGERGAISENGRNDGAAGNGSGGQYALYPNPNSGHFVLEAQYPEATPLTVHVYTAEGKTVRTYQRGSNTAHRIEGTISAKGQYLIEIVSNVERNLIKMLVQ